ncbi:MAG: carbon-nitrogen hydrolase family protein [Eubacterium sp.]
MENLKIALIQLLQPMGISDALSRGLNACKTAKDNGADIILFPEMWSIGYRPPFDNAFDSPDEPGHEADIEKWRNLALDESSDFISEFKKCAKELETAIVITYLKKGNPKPCNSLSVIDKNGNIVLTYSKVHTCSFSMEAFCQAGDSFNTAQLKTAKGDVTIGAMICFDREFPESARTLALKGAELILVPNCCEIDDNRKSQLKARAFENMTAVAMTNYAGADLGHSMAFDGMAYDENGYRDMLITELGTEEKIEIISLDIEGLRAYREKEVWGAKYRNPKAYII